MRIIIRKAVVSAIKQDAILSAEPLKLYVSHESGCEAALHAMNLMFNDENTDSVLLIDAENAFSFVNKKSFTQSIETIGSVINTFVSSCCSSSSRLFIIGG